MHPQWDPATVENDVALLKLDRPVRGVRMARIAIPSTVRPEREASCAAAALCAPCSGACGRLPAASPVLRLQHCKHHNGSVWFPPWRRAAFHRWMQPLRRSQKLVVMGFGETPKFDLSDKLM